MMKKQTFALFKWLCCIFIMLTSHSLFAQTQEDVVHLENGSVIRGRVIEYEPKGNIKIEIMGGSVLVYKGSDVVKIEKGEIRHVDNRPTERRKRERKTSHIPTNKGLYNTTSAGTLFGIDDLGGPSFGLSLSHVTGYRFHRLFGLGAGVGIMSMGEYPFVHIYGNIRSYFMKSSASLYYDMNIGYGIGLARTPSLFGGGNWSQPISQEGGLYLRPAIGLRFPSARKTHLCMDFGFVIQYAKYEYLDWNGSPVSEKRTFYRPSLRMSLTF